MGNSILDKFSKIINFLILFVLGIGVLLLISLFSIFGLHAQSAKFYVPPNKDIYECDLQWVHENHLEQFELGEKRILTCVYKCQDTHGQFDWFERTWDEKGCKIHSRVYKTQAKLVWK